MKTRPFGNTGWQVSEVGLGCWQIGGADWGEIDEASAFAIMETAVDCGVNFFDTADVYGNGRSESLVGAFQKRWSVPITVATKVGRGAGLYPSGYTEARLRAATEASLQRLGVEALDLTQLHCIPTQVMSDGEVFGWLRQLKQEGKIKEFAASVETVEEALLCLEQEGLCSLQVIFNVFRQKLITELFPQAKAKGVALIVRLPLASGLLGGKLTHASRFGANDHRTYNRDGQFFNVGETFAGLPYEIGVDLADDLKELVPTGMTLPQMAQRWILDHDAVSVVIPGASRSEQTRVNASVSDLAPLPAHLHEQLQRFYRDRVEKHIRGPY